MQNCWKPVGRLVGLELMRDDPVMNLHIFNGFGKKTFFNMFIELKLETIKSTKFMKNKKLEEITYTCSAAC